MPIGDILEEDSFVDETLPSIFPPGKQEERAGPKLTMLGRSIRPQVELPCLKWDL